MADRFEFTDLLDRAGGALSRGQRQRVALGRALLHDPVVVFLDEPTSGLDPTTADRLRDELGEIALDRTLLYATHNFHEAADLADRIDDQRATIEAQQGTIERQRERIAAVTDENDGASDSGSIVLTRRNIHPARNRVTLVI